MSTGVCLVSKRVATRERMTLCLCMRLSFCSFRIGKVAHGMKGCGAADIKLGFVALP